MTLIKKIDVEKHFAERRALKRAAARFATQPNTAHYPGTEPTGVTPDLTREPSSSSGSTASVAVTDGSHARRANETSQGGKP